MNCERRKGTEVKKWVRKEKEEECGIKKSFLIVIHVYERFSYNSFYLIFISLLSSPRFSFPSPPYRIQWKKLKDRLWKAIFTVTSFILWIYIFLLYCMNVWIGGLKWFEVLEWWTIVYSWWWNCEWSLENLVRRWREEEIDKVVRRGLWNQELLATS